MSRRQREGRGGKDHNGCGNAGCPVCSPGRKVEGPTRQELLADRELRESFEETAERIRERWEEFLEEHRRRESLPRTKCPVCQFEQSEGLRASHAPGCPTGEKE